jgi:hypothetical protein
VRFGVVACPSCRRVQVVDLRHARPGCRGCASPLDLATLRTFYKGDSESEARLVTLRVSSQREGMGIEDYARLLERIERERTGSVDEALADLAKRGEFGRDDLAAEMRRHAVAADADRVLDALVAENRVYEPRAGRFRFL